MGSSMTDNQFMIQTLNSLSRDYELKVFLLEKQIKSVNNWRAKGGVKLKFWEAFVKDGINQNLESGKEKALFASQFIVKWCSCEKLGHKAAQCKSKQVKEEKNATICNFGCQVVN